MNRRYAWGLVYALVGIAVVLLIISVIRVGDLTQTIRESQQQKAPVFSETNRAAQAAQHGTRRIENCTTPGRPCYDRGQRRLGRVVAGLLQGNQRSAAAAAACAASMPHPTYHAIYRCVVRTLQADRRH